MLFQRLTDWLNEVPARADTVIAGAHSRLTPMEKLERDVRRFTLAAEQASSDANRRRHLANLKRAETLLSAAQLEAR